MKTTMQRYLGLGAVIGASLSFITAAKPSKPAAAALSANIVVDQFGYLPDSDKIAVIRAPVEGFDAGSAFAPGSSYQLIDSSDGHVVFTKAPTSWQHGRTDPASGDKVWWFDFSTVKSPGTYFVLDAAKNLRSPPFEISPQVYRKVLVQAVRTFYYQRAGFEKKAAYAGKSWADAASHVGPLQDKNCRRYNAKNDASTERDLHGGWYDAGDYNKYTPWTANYIVGLLKAYAANPGAFGDDTNIPESGNGLADLLDEVRWGLSWLERMQNTDGSVLSVVGLASASPPSAATGQSLYGDASTTATLATAAAFANAALVFKGLPGSKWAAYSANMESRAERAYAWAEAHPQVLFKNNDAAAGTLGLAAGQQETDDQGRAMLRLGSACYLFELTGAARYRTYFEQHYTEASLIGNTFVSPFDEEVQEMLQHCGKLSRMPAAVRAKITESLHKAAADAPGLTAARPQGDAYMAGLPQYTWGSNSIKAGQGLVLLEAAAAHDVGHTAAMRNAAMGYLHYLHGVNPLGLVYLSNMASFGASRSVRAFFHSWFTAGRLPPPGFLTGGPNPSYKPESCCPNSCRGKPKGISCDKAALTPPLGQPPAKSYKDFNDGWPANSWEVTENSGAYQTRYIRLLSRFVPAL